MKLTLYLDDFKTEKIFSYLRWIFLFVAVILFYVPPIDQVLQFEHRTFPLLLTFGASYIVITHIVLHRMNTTSIYFTYIIKSGIIFDFIVLSWLLILTGGVLSPFFPITYLVVMHSTIYWKSKGALLSSIASTIIYSILLMLEATITFQSIMLFSLNVCFIWIVGLFGSMLVLRERKHFGQKKIFYELMVTDYLTGLNNHRSFQEELNMAMKSNKPFVLILGDVDYFKIINDRYGHMVGDHVLSNFGKVFNDIASKYNGKAFRYGGEEFAFIFHEQDERKLIAFFERLYKELNDVTFTDERFSVTMSFDVSSSSISQTRDSLLKTADKLLYEAKKRGKNQVVCEHGCFYINESADNQMTV